MEAAEREYTNLSLSQRYVPFGEVFRALFYRMLWMAGIAEPRSWATPEDLEFIMKEYQLLEFRPGAAECVQKLRDAGFTVWAFTAADITRVGGYFKNAGVELPAENLLSCDDAGVGKPDLRAYYPLLERLKAESDGAIPWFAAAHMWDVSAAKQAGYVSCPLSDLAKHD
jgi:2-haloacid dehalogenase